MSAPEERKDEDREYELLLAAHANRELSVDENRRLLDLAEEDPERGSDIALMDRIHAGFAAERRLRGEVAAPVDLSEEGDASYRRLAAKAAAAEEQLRVRLLDPQGAPAARPARRLLMPISLAALLIACLCFWLFSGGAASGPGTGPEMLGGKPENQVLGIGLTRIHLSAELSRSRPVFSWLSSVGASRYGAFIEDREGVVLMRRSPELAGTTRWQLSREELQKLEERMAASLPAGGLFLRIEGMDATGLKVASSGDLQIVLVD